MTDRNCLPNIIDGIIEAKREAQKMNIKVNMALINDRLAFSRLKTDWRDVPIVCGLKVAYTNELPDDVLFAVVNADTPPKTRDEQFAKLESENEQLRNKLKEIADHLLSNGVIVPPCKVGDKVYTTLCYGIRDWRIQESVIVEMRKRLGFNLEIIERITNDKGHCTYLPIVLENFGVTKFLTKEEAEEKLKELGK